MHGTGTKKLSSSLGIMGRKSKKPRRRNSQTPSVQHASSVDDGKNSVANRRASPDANLAATAPVEHQPTPETTLTGAPQGPINEALNQSLVATLKPTLDTATGIDICHLSAVLQRMMSDPKRIIAVRQDLHMGQIVTFLDVAEVSLEKNLLTGRIVAMDQTSATVKQVGSSRQWKLPYLAIDPAPRPNSPQVPQGMTYPTDATADDRAGQASRASTDAGPGGTSPAKRMSRDNFKAGDLVSFEDRYLQTHTGMIKRVNQYTATIDIGDVRWRVPFVHLRHVMDV